MKRKTFLKTCGYACLGSGFITGILQSCSPSKIITGKIEATDLVVPFKNLDFEPGNKSKYIIVRNDKLKFPICVYRLEDQRYSALLMQCTHKFAELQVFGNKLQCPAHGSEFSNTGKVTHGPAEKDLRTFPVSIVNNQLRITLK